MVSDSQVMPSMKELFEDQVKLYKQGSSITQRNTIPDTTEIPIENPRHWLKIPNVICVFVDMKGSTQLSASSHDSSTAATYKLYSETAVRVFAEFESPYIDVRGDGVLALFDEGQEHRAVAAAVTFKTFAKEVFVPEVKIRTGLTVGSHCGIDQKTVLVRKIGYKRSGGRSDRQNEVWGGKPVAMAAKLAGLSEDNQLLVSDRFFNRLSHEKVLKSCGCPGGTKGDLWAEIDVRDDARFDFDKAYSLSSIWCATHGREFCTELTNA